jgi:hypothetical protein
MSTDQPSSAPREREGENGKGRFKLVHDVSAEINTLFEATHQKPRGTLITHTEIEDITGHKKLVLDDRQRLLPNSAYSKIVRKWRKRMLEGPGKDSPDGPGIAVVSSPGVGYRFATVEEQGTIVPDSFERQAARKVKAAQKTVSCIPAKEMDDKQKRFRRERIRQTAESLDLSREQKRRRESYLSSPDTMPPWNSGR